MKKTSIVLTCIALLTTGTFFSVNAQTEDVKIEQVSLETEEDKVNNNEENQVTVEKTQLISNAEKKENLVLDKTNKLEAKENDESVATEETTPIIVTEEKTPIETELELKNQLSLVQDDAVITIKGGISLLLTTPLIVNSGQMKSLTIKSSDGQAVTLKNSIGKRHIEVIGDNDTDIAFENITLSGDTDAIGGGILYDTNHSHKLTGLTIADNTIKFSSWEEGFIKVKTKNSKFVLENVNFENNKIMNWKDGTGAAVLLFDTKNVEIQLNNVNLNQNSTANQQGSPIVAYLSDGSLQANNITLSQNEGAGYSGGFYFSGRGNACFDLTNSKFEGNTADYQGGALGISLKNQSVAYVSDSFFEGNFGKRGGGAILVEMESDASVFEIENSKFVNNKTSRLNYNPETGVESGEQSEGGAVSIIQKSNSGNIKINNSHFLENESHSGGALYIRLDNDAETQTLITNSIFENNTADFRGGALQLNNNDTSNVSYTIKDTIIRGNVNTGKDFGPGYYEGGQGGGIYIDDLQNNFAALKLENTMFDDNHSPFPLVWHYDFKAEDALNKGYRANVINSTTTTKPYDQFIKSYDNVYNGDDVFYDYSALTYYHISDENINVENYNAKQYVFSLVNQLNVKPIDPIAKGYKFLGWYTEENEKWDFDSSKTTENIANLYAHFEKEKEYTVHFDSRGGTLIDPIQNIRENSRITQPESPLREGYTFTGWYTNLTLSTPWIFEEAEVTDNIILYAGWSKNPETRFNVEFDSNGGSLIEGYKNIAGGSLIEKPLDPIRLGYKFIGWSKNIEFDSQWQFDTDPVTSDITLYAKWEKNTIVDPVDPIVPVEPVEPVAKVDESKKTEKTDNLPRTGINNNQIINVSIALSGLLILLISLKSKGNSHN
ncbi:MAG: InlB B-repeat-containing protein [Erysipelothrix sp.]